MFVNLVLFRLFIKIMHQKHKQMFIKNHEHKFKRLIDEELNQTENILMNYFV